MKTGDKKLLISLCAGKGARLRPYTDHTAKAMIEIHGIPILENQIRLISEYVTHNIVVGGYLFDTLYCGAGEKLLNKQFATTNMVASLMCAQDYFNHYDECIISYGDIIFNQGVIEELEMVSNDFSVVVDMAWLEYWKSRSDNPLLDAESLQIQDGLITDIGKKVDSVIDIQGQFIGLMKFSRIGMSIVKETFDRLTREGWVYVEDNDDCVSKKLLPTTMYMTDLIQLLIDIGHQVHPVCINGGWLEVDTVEDYRLAQLLTKRDGYTLVVQR